MLGFFFKQKTAYEMRISDWSSDVCSSDLIGDEQNDPLRHMLADQVERFAREVRMPPFARAGILIEEPHRVPMFGADRIAGQFFDAQSLDGARPFLAQLLALLRVQRGEEIVEARIARVRERSEEHTSELQSLMR